MRHTRLQNGQVVKVTANAVVLNAAKGIYNVDFSTAEFTTDGNGKRPYKRRTKRGPYKSRKA